MEFGSSRLNMLLVILCALSLPLNTVNAESAASTNSNQLLQKSNESSHVAIGEKSDSLTRRQDGGFDLLNYFIGNRQQQVQQNQQATSRQQQLRQASVQQPQHIQQQHQLQQEQLVQQQLQEQQRLQQQQQQQLLQLQQQQQVARSNDVYQENVAQQQQQQALNRDGGYGNLGGGGGYVQQSPKQIGISIGAGRPPNVIGVGNILTLLPRIINILSGGGKVMFGVELGNNFYFGPVGAKPLYG